MSPNNPYRDPAPPSIDPRISVAIAEYVDALRRAAQARVQFEQAQREQAVVNLKKEALDRAIAAEASGG